jgi:hypothetical protein
MKRPAAALALILAVTVPATVTLTAAPATTAAAAVIAAATDISGTWNVDGDVVGNPVKFACALKQSGEKLSGTATIQGKEVPMTGSVKDRVVSFTFDVDHEGTTYTNVYTGKIGDNGIIEGTIAVGGVDGTFTAKKQ